MAHSSSTSNTVSYPATAAATIGRIVTVSMRTLDIVDSLPSLDL